MIRQTVFLAASYTASAASKSFMASPHRGLRLFLDVNGVSGTSPTADFSVQVYDPLGAVWSSLGGASFVQATAAGQQTLTIYPGIAETANVSVSDHIGGEYRVNFTIGGSDTPTLNFSLSAELLP